jgi:hypothetical protein
MKTKTNRTQSSREAEIHRSATGRKHSTSGKQGIRHLASAQGRAQIRASGGCVCSSCERIQAVRPTHQLGRPPSPQWLDHSHIGSTGRRERYWGGGNFLVRSGARDIGSTVARLRTCLVRSRAPMATLRFESAETRSITRNCSSTKLSV